MKKGGIMAYGTMIAVFAISSVLILYITETGPVSSTIATKEGNLMSFENKNELLTKSFDLGIKYIGQRAAYDLGKTGGLRYESFWSIGYPTIDKLKEELEIQVKNNLPDSYKEGDIEVSWTDAEIAVEDYDNLPCGPLDDSVCFFLRGTKDFSLYDDSIKTRISDEHEIDAKVDSSYFKLLNAGRAILEDNKYVSELNDVKKLQRMLNLDFIGLRFDLDATIVPNGVDIVDIIIRDILCRVDASCLAPLKAYEIQQMGKTHDFLALHFKVEAEQTAFTPVDFDFLIVADPKSGEASPMCSV